MIRFLLIFVLLLPNFQVLAQPLNHFVTYPLIMSQSSQSLYPMGIADYGISPNGPYIRETTQWLGIVYVESLSAISNINNSYFNHTVSFQLNVVLNYEYNGKTYALWLQDVAFYNTLTHGLYFVDNIWNFSAPNANVTGVFGNGGISSSFYGYVDKESYTNMTPPFVIGLLVNVTTNDKDQPVIYFWYNDGNGWVNFDTVTVNVTNASNVHFLVDGYNHTPNGLYYDAALVIGGPYSGSTAQIINGTVFLQLFYWNGHNFQEVRNAYDVGYDTGETVKNASAKYYINPFNGALYAEIAAGKENPGIFLWDEDNTTQLTIHSPVNNGYIYVYNESLPYSKGTKEALKVPFIGAEATLTLYPMTYAILVYSKNENLVSEANIYAVAGQNVSTNTTQFSISISKTQISLNDNESYTLNITINAYGNVTINVISPSSVKTSFTQELLYVQGKKTINLTICPTKNGVFNVIVNVSLFPGFYEIQLITLYVSVHEKLFVTFEFNVIGQSLPQEPEINLTYPNGTTVTLQLYNFEVICVPPGTTYVIQQVISEGDVRWATPTLITGVINENVTINVTYYEQYLVNFEYKVINGQWNLTPPNVTYQYFSKLEAVTVPAKVWVNYNSTYYYSPSVAVGDERIFSANYKGAVTSLGTVNVYYILQYYITLISPIPVYAIINGENVSLSTDWYNFGEVIQIENITYSSSDVRYVITSILPSETVNITSPMTIKINTMEQFYVTVSSPIPVYALINGKNETLESGWYNANTTIYIENIPYYPTKDLRYIITNVYPSTFIIVDYPLTINITTVKQYYVTVNSNIPLRVYMSPPSVPFPIPLTLTYLNSSWITKGTVIYVLNYTYYVSNNERYVLSGIYVNPFIKPSYTVEIATITNNGTYHITPYLIVFVVDSPVTVNVTTIKQFLVTINNVSTWYNQGIKITLKANVSIYYVGEFVGTYNVSPGTVITVNSPIIERLVLRPNYAFYEVIVGILVVIVMAVLLTRRRKK